MPSDSDRPRLKPGDFVLVEHYFSGEDQRGYPGRMVLAEVYLDSGTRITPKSKRVLTPVLSNSCPLFGIELSYGGIEYVLCENSDIAVDLRAHTNVPTHLGIRKVLGVLDRTPNIGLMQKF